MSATPPVAVAALDLFVEQGFEATSVEQIAQAAGISRSTFFRQFGGKDDVIFADHEIVLGELEKEMDAKHDNPWVAVCEASVRVYQHFAADPTLARRRYQVVRQVPALREREILTVVRYERLFVAYLRRALPGIDPLDAVGFAALVTSLHNYVLRRLARGTEDVPASVLVDALDKAMRRFGVHPDETEAAEDDLVVAVFPRRMPAAEIARRLGTQLP